MLTAGVAEVKHKYFIKLSFAYVYTILVFIYKILLPTHMPDANLISSPTMHSFPVYLHAVHKVAHGLLHNSETENHQRYKAAINNKQLQTRCTNPLINGRGLLYAQFRRVKKKLNSVRDSNVEATEHEFRLM